MTTGRVWVLGASDPEMARIEEVLRARGEAVVHATRGGARVRAGDAYRADMAPIEAEAVVLVECGGETLDRCSVCRDRASGRGDGLGLSDRGTWGGLGPCGDCHAWPSGGVAGPRRCDHHAPGDVGYGLGPEHYLRASSLGQVLALLGLPATHEDRLIAAADHCLGAAYRGECLGVYPDQLLADRVRRQAAFRGVDEMVVRIEIQRAREAIAEAPMVQIAGVEDAPHTDDHGWKMSVCDGCRDYPILVHDLRGRYVPGLVEAAAVTGAEYVSGPLPGERTKYTVSGRPETVRAWLARAERDGMHDTYGDPARGFAGGYV